MATKIRTQSNFYLPGAKQNEELRKRFKSLLIWEHNPVSEAVTTSRKRKSNVHSKTDERRVIEDNLDHKPDDWRSQEILEVDKIKPLSNPSDPYDDFNVFWNPRELLDATKALATYDVKELYKKNPYTIKNVLHLVLLIIKYKPLLKDLLEIGEYFERFPEDAKDENIVLIALFDILCRGNGITLENEMDASLRSDYKNIGLKVVYMQVEKDKVHYFEQVHDRLNDVGGSSVHDLLPTTIPMQINIDFPMIFDIWINRSEFDVSPEELLEQDGFKRAGTRTSSGLTYNEIADLPYFFELGVSNYSDFIKSSHYCNHIFITADRNHCLAMVQVIRQLCNGGITKGTIIQTHILSLSATAYFAYLLSIAFPSSTMKLKVFGADKMKESFESYFELLNLKNVQVFSERFYIVNCRKKGIASTTCVLVNPETVFNPSLNLINETMNRGCDIVYLQSAYELFSENDTYDYSFINQYTHDLKELAKCNVRRALSIPKVKFIIYQSFDLTETPDDNIALYVVKFARECSHTSVVSVKESMSPTEVEDANYKYCRMLHLYFMQGNTPSSIVSPAVWGSKPPFITTIYRVDPVIYHTETEGDESGKHSTYGKLSSKSNSIKYPPHARDKSLKKYSSMAKSMSSESRRTKSKNSVGISGFSTDSDFNKGDKKIFKGSRKGFEREGQSSTVSSGLRNSLTLMQVRGSPPDFKKMILEKVMLKNEPMSFPSKKVDPILKKKLKNKRTKIVGDKKEVLFRDQIENIDSQHASESVKSSLIKNKESISISSFETNEKNVKGNKKQSKKGSVLMEDVLLRDEGGTIDSQRTRESTNISEINGKLPSTSHSAKKSKITAGNQQNKKIFKKESILVEDVSLKDEVNSIESKEILEFTKLSEIKSKQANTSQFVNKSRVEARNEPNKRLFKKESILVEDVSLRDEVDSIDSQEISEFVRISQIKVKKPSTSQSVKKSKMKARNEPNRRISKKDSINVEDIPSHIKSKSGKEFKKGSSGSKSFPQTSERKNIKWNKYPRTSKNIDNVKEEQTLFRVQHSPVKTEQITNEKTKNRNLPKRPYKKYERKILPTNYLKVKKEPPIISFGTIIRPKSNPTIKSEKNLPLKKVNTTLKNKTDVKEVYLASNQQKPVNNSPYIKKKSIEEEMPSVGTPRMSTKEDLSANSDGVKSLKFYINSRKRLSKMQKRFQNEILHNFQTHFFHPTKQFDLEEKSSVGQYRPSSSVSWKTYAKTARKVSELNLIKLLKKENLKKEKKRRKKTERSITPISTESELHKIMDDEQHQFSRRFETVLWSEYKTADFDKFIEFDEKERKPSLPSSLLEIDKSEKNSITSSLLEMNQKELKPSTILSHSAQSSNKMIYKRKETSRNKIKLKNKIENVKRNKKKRKNKSGISANNFDELYNQQFKSKSSLIKVVLENSEGTQTKIPRKTQVYDVGTQAGNLKVYLSLTSDEERKKSLQYYTDLVRRTTNTYYSRGPDSMGDDLLSNIASNEAVIMKKGELNPKQDHVTVSKMISWYQQLKSQAPIPPRVVSYNLRRRWSTRKRSTVMSLTEESRNTVEEDSEDMIEEGVDDIPPLNQDYKFEDAPTILTQMKMYDAGERNLNKLIATDPAEFVDFNIMRLKVMGENKPKEIPVQEEREEIVAMNKNLLKFKAEALSMETNTEEDGFEEEEPFNMETKGKDMNSLLTRLIDNIFETDTKSRKQSVDEVSIHTVEHVIDKKGVSHGPAMIVDSEKRLQTTSFEEVWKNTTREAWNKRNIERKMEPEEGKKKGEVEENLRQSDIESERIGTSIIDFVPKRTPTDGLSPLARELYEIRDTIEFYLHSKVEPLDWRVMIDRRDEV